MSERNHSIDLIKGVCILFVIITHVTWIDKEKLTFLFPFWLEMAVPIFMIISGYVYSMSYVKHDISDFFKAYSFKNIFDKVIRFTIPFIFIFSFEYIYFFLFDSKFDFGLKKTIIYFLTGGFGPGSYYFPVMIQFIFLFPFIFFIIKKYDFKGFYLLLIANLLFEVIKTQIGMTQEIYRLLIFRYILVISFGCYMAIGKKAVSKLALYCGMSVGIIYIICFKYMGYKPYYTYYWTSTSMWASLFILPIAFKIINSNLKSKTLELLGMASYDIFLTQMVYYFIFVKTKFYTVNFTTKPVQIVTNTIICCLFGVLFYYIETPIANYMKKMICGKTNNEK